MAREIEQWVTINGTHVPIYSGESKQDAINRAIAEKNEDTKNAQIVKNKEQADRLNGKKTEFPLSFEGHRVWATVTDKPVDDKPNQFGEKEYHEVGQMKQNGVEYTIYRKGGTVFDPDYDAHSFVAVRKDDTWLSIKNKRSK